MGFCTRIGAGVGGEVPLPTCSTYHVVLECLERPVVTFRAVRAECGQQIKHLFLDGVAVRVERRSQFLHIVFVLYDVV